MSQIDDKVLSIHNSDKPLLNIPDISHSHFENIIKKNRDVLKANHSNRRKKVTKDLKRKLSLCFNEQLFVSKNSKQKNTDVITKSSQSGKKVIPSNLEIEIDQGNKSEKEINSPSVRKSSNLTSDRFLAFSPLSPFKDKFPDQRSAVNPSERQSIIKKPITSNFFNHLNLLSSSISTEYFNSRPKHPDNQQLNLQMISKPISQNVNSNLGTDKNWQDSGVFYEENIISPVLLNENNQKTFPEKDLEKRRKIIKNMEKVFDSSDDKGTDDEEVKEEKKSFQLVFDIDSYFIKFWENLILIIILYTLLITPMTFAFDIFTYTYNHTVDLVFDVIYISDIVIHFFTPFIDHEGKLITSNSHIIEHYLTSWFPTDFISTLHILEYASKNEKFKSIFKSCSVYLRLLKTLKIIKKFEKIEKILEKVHISIRKIKLFEYILTFLILTHNFTCMWIFVAKFDTLNWISHSYMETSTSIELYIASLYFIWGTMFTIGYGDIVPINMYERIFNIIIMVFGIFIFSFIVCYLSEIIKDNERLKSQLNQKKKILNDILSKFPQMDETESESTFNERNNFKSRYEEKSLYDKIYSYLNYDFKNNKEQKVNLINELPFNYRNMILLKFFKNFINRFSFFRCFSNLNSNDNFLSKIISKMKPYHLSKNEIIVKEGQLMEDLWFIKKGVVSVELGKEFLNKRLFSLNKYDCFSVMNIINGEKSEVSMRVISKKAECLVIEKKDFIELSIDVSEDMNKILEIFNYNSTNISKNILRIKKEIKRRELELTIRGTIRCSENLKSSISRSDLKKRSLMKSNNNISELNKSTLKVKFIESSRKLSETSNKIENENNDNNEAQIKLELKSHKSEEKDKEVKEKVDKSKNLTESFKQSIGKTSEEGISELQNLSLRKRHRNEFKTEINSANRKVEIRLVLKRSNTNEVHSRKEKGKESLNSAENEIKLKKRYHKSLHEMKKTNKNYNDLNSFKEKKFGFYSKSDVMGNTLKKKKLASTFKIENNKTIKLPRQNSKFQEMNDIILKKLEMNKKIIKDRTSLASNEFESIINKYKENKVKEQLNEKLMKRLDHLYGRIVFVPKKHQI